MGIYGFEGSEPQVAADAFVAPTATLIGDVVLGAESSVWFGAVLRGDFDRIDVGEGSCVQDNAVDSRRRGAADDRRRERHRRPCARCSRGA